MMSPDRADPLDDISDFAPVAKPKVSPAAVRKVSEANGFRSREPAPAARSAPVQRRHRTGRNAQLNLKVTPQTLARFVAIADREKWLLAETLEYALDALDALEAKAEALDAAAGFAAVKLKAGRG